ncbi:heterokaryon incompatibility protein-domain-containing protein [Phyllosticta capitalensis]
MRKFRAFFKTRPAFKQPREVSTQPGESTIQQCMTCTTDDGSFKHDKIKVKHIQESATRASEKCKTCGMLLACLERCNTTGFDEESYIWFPSAWARRSSRESAIRNGSLLVRLVGHNKSLENFEIFTLPGTKSPWRELGAAPELLQDSSSKTSLEYARKWLTDCRKNHKKCHSPTECQPQLPTRLIYVLSSQEGGPVRLIETANGQTGRYLCLSHCWGDPEIHPHPLKTEKESIECHKEGIPWRSLPKTFHDAISFVRLLGESYIWIDSLCIIQDCPDDWSKEASKMADIFTNSYLTLAATNSTNSTEGFFSTPDDTYKSYPYDFKKHGSTYSLFFRKSLSHFFDPDDVAMEPAPLLKRAWVYQERLLSPRTLHFGNQELLWECKEISTCQCGLSIDNDLTKESDRLPAIAGVAKRMQSIQGREDYLAGLWKESLLEDLLWRRTSSSLLDYPASSCRSTCVAPSWSWVCMKATRIDFHDTRISERVAYLVDVKVQSDQHDAFMKASSGSVTIKSFLLTVKGPMDSLSPVFVPEPLLSGATISSDEFVDRGSTHCYEDDLESLGMEDWDDGCIEAESLIYCPDERGIWDKTLPEDLSIRYLLTHTMSKTSYLLALRPQEDPFTFERIGLLVIQMNPQTRRYAFRSNQMQTITIV